MRMRLKSIMQNIRLYHDVCECEKANDAYRESFWTSDLISFSPFCVEIMLLLEKVAFLIASRICSQNGEFTCFSDIPEDWIPQCAHRYLASRVVVHSKYGKMTYWIGEAFSSNGFNWEWYDSNDSVCLYHDKYWSCASVDLTQLWYSPGYADFYYSNGKKLNGYTRDREDDHTFDTICDFVESAMEEPTRVPMRDIVFALDDAMLLCVRECGSLETTAYVMQNKAYERLYDLIESKVISLTDMEKNVWRWIVENHPHLSGKGIMTNGSLQNMGDAKDMTFVFVSGAIDEENIFFKIMQSPSFPIWQKTVSMFIEWMDTKYHFITGGELIAV